MPKLIAPSQDEFDSWKLHPVSMYVAEAYRLMAQTQRDAWSSYLDSAGSPEYLAAKRLELSTREDAYNAFLETTLERYIAIVDPEARTGAAAKHPRSNRSDIRRSGSGH